MGAIHLIGDRAAPCKPVWGKRYRLDVVWSQATPPCRHDLPVAPCEHRNLETELANAAAHPIHRAVVFAWVTRVFDQTVDGPLFDALRRRNQSYCNLSPLNNSYGIQSSTENIHRVDWTSLVWRDWEIVSIVRIRIVRAGLLICKEAKLRPKCYPFGSVLGPSSSTLDLSWTSSPTDPPTRLVVSL